MTGPLAPDARADRSLRPGLRRLSTGLLAYGALGIVLAMLGLVAMVWVGGRLGSLTDRVSTQVESVTATLEDTGAVLTDAGDTASSFATTLTQTAESLDKAADSVSSIQPKLADLGAQFRSVDFLGNQPLARAADVIAGINTSLDGLDSRLHAIATSLTDNRASLEANTRSLTALGSRLTILARDLRTGTIEDSLADIRVIILVTFLLLTAWTAFPAVAAMLLGLWLRRNL